MLPKIKRIPFITFSIPIVCFLLWIIFYSITIAAESVIDPNVPGVTGTKHNLSIYGPGSVQASFPGTTEICVFCHTPHASNTDGPLWNKQTPGISYALYGTYTLYGTTALTLGQPTGSSRLCLSCHDGTIAIGSLLNAPGAVLGQTLNMEGVVTSPGTGETTGALYASYSTNIGTDLSNDHPISFKYSDSYDAFNTELKDPGINNVNIAPAVLDNSSEVQCTSCHDPHSKTFIKFLRASLEPVPITDYGAPLCNLCHIKNYWNNTYLPIHRENDTFKWTGTIGTDQNPWEPYDFGSTGPATTLSSAIDSIVTTIPATDTTNFPASGRIKIDNEFIDYTGKTAISFTGVVRGVEGTTPLSHIRSVSVIGSDFTDDTLKMHGCFSCHRSHGGTVGKQLLKGRNADSISNPKPMEAEEWTCLNCHNGKMLAGSTIIKDINAVFNSTYKHDVKDPAAYGRHRSERFSTGSPRIRENLTIPSGRDRHAECADCHNPHELKNGSHTTGFYGNMIGNNLIGTWGVQPTWGTAGTPANTYTELALNNTSSHLEGYLCLKCHSSYSYGTTPPLLSGKFPNGASGYESDPSADFNVNNYTFHPVFESTGKNQPTSTANLSWPANGLGLTNTFTCAVSGTCTNQNDITHTRFITCSDCHGNSNYGNTNPKGPHGSANKYILKNNETGAIGSSDKNFCYNCHRRDVYGDENYCDPATENVMANYSRVTHPPDNPGKTDGVCNSPFYQISAQGPNRGNNSNTFGVLCLSCHGGGIKTQQGIYTVFDSIHGSNTGLGNDGGTNELGKRMMNGACITGHTHATKTPAAGVKLWFKPDLTNDNVCNYNASTNPYAPYAETVCGADTADNDGDTVVNDGCPAVGTPETNTQCSNTTDDDGDLAINDGCPAVVSGNTANYDYWPSPW